MTKITTSALAPAAEPIDQNTLGRVPVLSKADIQLAVEATRCELLESVDQQKFGYWLNNSVERTIRDQLTLRLTPARLRDLRDSIETYRDLSRLLLHSEFPPPMPPPDWMREVETWIGAAEKDLATRSSGGASLNVVRVSFLPKALGLLHAGFGIVPDTSVSRLSKDETGAAFRFVSKISATVRKRIIERGFSERVDPSLAKRAAWTPVSDDTLGHRLKSALGYRPESGEWTGTAIRCPETGKLQPIVENRSDLAWRIYSDRFRPLIQKTKNKTK